MNTAVSILRLGGTVERRREGRHVFYELTETGEALAAVARALLTPPGTGLAD